MTIWAVVVAQLAEQSLPTPEIHSSHPVIALVFIEYFLTVNSIEKTNIKEKEPWNGPLKYFIII